VIDISTIDGTATGTLLGSKIRVRPHPTEREERTADGPGARFRRSGVLSSRWTG
jgi:hypothetical protein